MLAYDHIREGSPLTAALLAVFRDNPRDVVEFTTTAKPGDFGGFAPMVFEYAARGDIVGERILARAVCDIEASLGHVFERKRWLDEALAHAGRIGGRRRVRGHAAHERLEFLGDSILGMLVNEYLYLAYPSATEGELTRMKANMVSEPSLAVRIRS